MLLSFAYGILLHWMLATVLFLTLLLSKLTELQPSIRSVPAYIKIETSPERLPGNVSLVGTNTSVNDHNCLVHDGDILVHPSDSMVENDWQTTYKEPSTPVTVETL